MSLRKVNFVEGEFFHIYNRGNSKQDIFIDDSDRERFVKLLYLCNSNTKINFREDILGKKIDVWDFDKGDSIIAIGAWVLMPNHFHLYLTIPKGRSFGKLFGGNGISVFMKKLCTAYTMYFNKKYKRTGSLFEGRFKSVHIKNEPQAQYLFAYIHLNPIKLIQSDWNERGILNKKSAFEFLGSYRWSSYHDFLSRKRLEGKILDKGNFLSYFKNEQAFQKDILRWFDLKTREFV